MEGRMIWYQLPGGFIQDIKTLVALSECQFFSGFVLVRSRYALMLCTVCRQISRLHGGAPWFESCSRPRFFGIKTKTWLFKLLSKSDIFLCRIEWGWSAGNFSRRSLISLICIWPSSCGVMFSIDTVGFTQKLPCSSEGDVFFAHQPGVEVSRKAGTVWQLSAKKRCGSNQCMYVRQNLGARVCQYPNAVLE